MNQQNFNSWKKIIQNQFNHSQEQFDKHTQDLKSEKDLIRDSIFQKISFIEPIIFKIEKDTRLIFKNSNSLFFKYIQAQKLSVDAKTIQKFVAYDQNKLEIALQTLIKNKKQKIQIKSEQQIVQRKNQQKQQYLQENYNLISEAQQEKTQLIEKQFCSDIKEITQKKKNDNYLTYDKALKIYEIQYVNFKKKLQCRQNQISKLNNYLFKVRKDHKQDYLIIDKLIINRKQIINLMSRLKKNQDDFLLF